MPAGQGPGKIILAAGRRHALTGFGAIVREDGDCDRQGDR